MAFYLLISYIHTYHHSDILCIYQNTSKIIIKRMIENIEIITNMLFPSQKVHSAS